MKYKYYSHYARVFLVAECGLGCGNMRLKLCDVGRLTFRGEDENDSQGDRNVPKGVDVKIVCFRFKESEADDSNQSEYGAR